MHRIPLPLANKKLTAIYDRLPKIACKGLCHDQCTVIVMSRLEWLRIVKAMGGREPESPPPGVLRCPMLSDDNRCRVYGVRPFVCRVYGVTEKLRCPHGCQPDRWLTDDEAAAMVQEIRALSGEELLCTHRMPEDKLEKLL